MPAGLLRSFLFSGCGCTVLINPHAVYLCKLCAVFCADRRFSGTPAVLFPVFSGGFFCTAGFLSAAFSANRGLMCGYLLLFHDSFIIFHVKNNAALAYIIIITLRRIVFAAVFGRGSFV